MAGADPFKTGNTAFRLGLAKALVPFVFVYSPGDAAGDQGLHLGRVLRDHRPAASSASSCWRWRSRATGSRGMPAWERLCSGVASVLVISPEPHRDADRPRARRCRCCCARSSPTGTPVGNRIRSADTRLRRHAAAAPGGQRTLLLPPPVSKASPLTRRGGRTERHGLSPPIATLDAAADRRAKSVVRSPGGGVCRGCRSSPPPDATSDSNWPLRARRSWRWSIQAADASPSPLVTTKAMPSSQGRRRRGTPISPDDKRPLSPQIPCAAALAHWPVLED